YPKGGRLFFFSILGALASLIPSASLAMCLDMLSVGKQNAPHVVSVLELPFAVLCLCGGFSLAAVAAVSVLTRRSAGRELSAGSLCEGLDQMPVGICCSMQDGFPRLVNDTMQRISNDAFGVGVFDAALLERRFAERSFEPGCEVDDRDGIVFLRLPDGSVRHFVRGNIAVGGREIIETIAYDVTDSYNDMLEEEKRNEHLAQVNRTIREYDRGMDRIVREKEVLAAKIWLHGELGQCLLSIEGYLNGDNSREAVTNELSRTVSLLRSNTAPEHSEDRMSALFEAADVVGVKINIDGEFPTRNRDIIEIAIHECLTNTIKHAGGHTLDVKILQTDGAVTVELTNDGEPPRGPIEETGGLKDLRAMVERRGGEMLVEHKPRFLLKLRLC
nr:hypothetical protein [Clostridia bacterium]